VPGTEWGGGLSSVPMLAEELDLFILPEKTVEVVAALTQRVRHQSFYNQVTGYVSAQFSPLYIH